MATTFQTSSPEYHSAGDKRSIAWGVSLAIVLALAVVFMMRTISQERGPTSATGLERPAIEEVENGSGRK